ncbi:MAG: ABC transporter permease, partial [Candidatus Zixiibacteriota bacterium]
MRLSIIYNIFVRDFKKQKKRITLTLLALAWGTISIMLLLGFGEGLHRQMTINSKGLGEGIAIMWGGQTSIPYKGMGKGRRIHLLPEDSDYLKARIPELKEIGGQYDCWGATLKYGDNIVSEHVVGVPPNFEQMRNYIPERGGRMINDLDVKLRRRVAFLGNDLKDRLFGEDDAVGEQILVNSISFTVIGVLKKKLQNSAYGGMDEDILAIPHTTFVAIFGGPYFDEIIYQIHNLDENKLVERKVFEAMGARHKFDPDDDRALSIWDTVAGNREFDNIMLGVKIFMMIIGGLTLLIAGV